MNEYIKVNFSSFEEASEYAKKEALRLNCTIKLVSSEGVLTVLSPKVSCSGIPRYIARSSCDIEDPACMDDWDEMPSTSSKPEVLESMVKRDREKIQLLRREAQSREESRRKQAAKEEEGRRRVENYEMRSLDRWYLKFGYVRWSFSQRMKRLERLDRWIEKNKYNGKYRLGMSHYWTKDSILKLALFFEDEKLAVSLLCEKEIDWATGDHFDLEAEVGYEIKKNKSRALSIKVLEELLGAAHHARCNPLSKKDKPIEESRFEPWMGGRARNTNFVGDYNPFSDDSGAGVWGDYMGGDESDAY